MIFIGLKLPQEITFLLSAHLCAAACAAFKARLKLFHSFCMQALQVPFKPTSTPFSMCLYSGQMNELPAYAASMCIQMFSSLPAVDKKYEYYNTQHQNESIFFLLYKKRSECERLLTHILVLIQGGGRMHMRGWCQGWRRTAQHKGRKSTLGQKYMTQMVQDLHKLCLVMR